MSMCGDAYWQFSFWFRLWASFMLDPRQHPAQASSNSSPAAG